MNHLSPTSLKSLVVNVHTVGKQTVTNGCIERRNTPNACIFKKCEEFVVMEIKHWYGYFSFTDIFHSSTTYCKS